MKTYLDFIRENNDLCPFDTLDDYIDKWHEGTDDTYLSLREYLGFSINQYGKWLIDADNLILIINGGII